MTSAELPVEHRVAFARASSSVRIPTASADGSWLAAVVSPSTRPLIARPAR